jgi:glycosyltransferase involved in cell wall biosynthesis
LSSAKAAGRPRALLAAHLDWGAPARVGSHHIARSLVEAGWDVAYVSNAISPVQAVRDWSEFRSRLGRHAWRGERLMDGHLWAFMPFALVTPHNAPVLGSRLVHERWQRLTLPNLVEAVRRRGFGDLDLLFIESPAQAFWLDAIRYRRSAARVMDRMSGFRRYSAEMQRLEERVVRSVDLVAYSARSLESDVSAMGAKATLHLPNGVDYRLFAEGDASIPKDLAAIPRPRAIYVGAMDNWFDFVTINEVAERMPDVSFVFIGPDGLARQRLRERPNVHLLGPRPHPSLPGYLHNADVGLIPFDAAGSPELVNAVHPLKLYEYLAAGLPVVATRWQELESLDSPAVLCVTPDDYVVSLRSAILSPPDPGIGRDYSRGADWSGRVAAFLRSVGKTRAGID